MSKATKGQILFAAITAGMIDGMITYPVETLKIKMQIMRRNAQKQDPASKPATAGPNAAACCKPQSFGIVSTAKAMWKQGGIAAFYPGLGYHLMGELTKSVWRYTLFEGVKHAYLRLRGVPKGGELRVPDNIAISTLSATGETLLVVQPWDRLKIMGIGGASPMTVARKVLREEGLSGLVKNVYKGLDMTWARQWGNNVWAFTMFYYLKNATLRLNPGQKALTPSQKFVYGGLSGAAGAVFTMPLDTLKSVKQKDPNTKGQGTMAIASDLYRRDGVSAFYRGTGARTALLFLKRAISFLCYETTLEILTGKKK